VAELVDAGAAKLDPKTGALLVQCKGSTLSTDGDAPDYGDAPVFAALGIVAMPYPADDNGGAQFIVANDVTGLDGAVIGGRDTRTSKIVGNLKPGDTVVHSTGPKMAAQLQLKEDKRQAVLVSKDTRGQTMVAMLDGVNDKVQIAAFGGIIELSRENGIVLSHGGAGLQIKDGVISQTGTIVLGGRTPTLPVLAGASGPAGVATPGVFVGA
jgi:hypothetical protein